MSRCYLPVALLGLALCAACAASLSEGRRTAALQAYAQKFNDALRWRSYAVCERLLAPEAQQPFRERVVARQEDLRVTDAEITGVTWSEDRFVATVQVRVAWTILPSITEQRGTLEQRWEDRQAGWLLVRMAVAGGDGAGPLDLP